MGSPKYKIFSAENDYIASCKYLEDAAAIIAMRGDGATIRLGHSPRATLWAEGKEAQPAGESYDFVAVVAGDREDYISLNAKAHLLGMS